MAIDTAVVMPLVSTLVTDVQSYVGMLEEDSTSTPDEQNKLLVKIIFGVVNILVKALT